jgi:predicted phage terminase large subunit-like protein
MKKRYSVTMKRKILRRVFSGESMIAVMQDTNPKIKTRTTVNNWKKLYFEGRLGPKNLHRPETVKSNKAAKLPQHILSAVFKDVKREAEFLTHTEALWPKKPLRGLLDFSRDVLGYTDLTEQTHGRFAKAIENVVARREYYKANNIKRRSYLLCLEPRGSFKTTLGPISTPLWILSDIDKDARICIDSEATQLSQNHLHTIRHNMIANEKLAEEYGVMAPTTNKRSAGNRFRSTAYYSDSLLRTDWRKPEPSIFTSGIDQVKVGWHMDFIFGDDYHSEKNTQSDEMIAKVKKHIRLNSPKMDPEACYCITGTRWDDKDAYGWIIDEMNVEGEWIIIVDSAIREDGTLFFPERLTEEFLAAERRSMGPYLFNCQYQNDPIPIGDAPLKMEWLHTYTPKERPSLDELSIVIILDPASTSTRRSDYSGIIVQGWDCTETVWVLDIIRDKDEPGKIIKHMVDLVARYTPPRIHCVGIETIGRDQFLQHELERQLRLRFNGVVPVRIENVSHRQASKEDRIIQAMAPLGDAGLIRIPESYEFYSKFHGETRDMVKAFLEEWRRFPRAKHDDLLDAMTYGWRLRYLPQNKEGMRGRLGGLFGDFQRETEEILGLVPLGAEKFDWYHRSWN